MSNPSDRELDHLSREAAGRFEPDDISSWEKLEQLLDKEEDDRPSPLLPFFGRRPLVYGLLLVAMAVAGYFVYYYEQKNNKAPGTASTSIESGKNTADKKQDLPDADSQKSNHDKIVGADKSTSDKSADPNTLANDHPTVDHTAGNAKSSPTAKSKLNLPGSFEARSDNLNKDKSKTLTVVARGDGFEVTNDQKKNKGNRNATMVAGSSFVTGGSSQPVAGKRDPAIANPDPLQFSADKSIWVSDSSLRHLVFNKPVSNTATDTKKSRPLKLSNPLHLGFVVAPDYTHAQSRASEQLSYNIGLSVGYQFLNHWSINTGLSYTVKYYSANGYDFHDNTIWGLDYVDGNCHMMEIPLTLRYDFNPHAKTTFFVNGGASTYLMRKESYSYYYAGNPIPYKKSYATNESYWMAEAAFSFGVEHQIGKTLSLQVEPFFRIPLSGVGYGNLDLSSYGVAFSIRYSPWFRKK